MKKESAIMLKGYLIPALVVLVVFLIIPFVLMPQIERIKEKNTEVQEGEARFERLNQKIADLALVDETKESIKLLELEKVIPGDKKIAQLIVGVRDIANESGLAITEMNFKPGRVGEEESKSATISALSKKAKANLARAEKEDKNNVNFEVNLYGSFDKIKTFLTKLEGAKRLMGINAITAERDEEDPEKYRISMNIYAPLKPAEKKEDIVSEPLPLVTAAHDALFDFLVNLKGYTTKKVDTVPTGVPDPFKTDKD